MRQARDATSGCVIAERLRLAHTHWTRLRGLLGTRSLPQGDGLWIKPSRQVHMFGMRYAIDVVFLDERLRVVHLVRDLAPGKVSPRVAAATSVIELPAGTIERIGLREGAQVEIDPEEHADAGIRRSLHRLLLVTATLVLCTVVAADPDLWGHVRYGQDAIDAGGLSRTATHTFTASGYPWINHENLAEVVFAFLVREAGVSGLLLLRCILGFGLVGLMIGAAVRHGASPLVTTFTIVLAALNIAPGWTVRPQLFTFALFGLQVVILDRCFDGGRKRWLWLLPPLFAVWANAHGGFLAGWCILALYLGCRGLEAARERRWGDLGAYGAVLAASGLATLLNPYGIELVRWLVADLVPPRPEITEWAAIWPPGPHFVPFTALLVVTVAAWIGSSRRRDATQAVVLLVVAVQSILHVRHIPLFATLVGFWLPAHVESLWCRLRSRPAAAVAGSSQESRSGERAFRGVMGVCTAVLAIVLVTRLGTIWVDKASYPVEAFAYMARQDLGGRLVAYFDWSQYAIAAFAPPTTVDFDGRFRTCYPQEIADLHFDFFLGRMPGRRWRSDRSPPIEPARVLELGAPELALLNRRSPHASHVMRSRADWVLLYQDGLAELWGRRNVYDEPTSPRFVPPEERSISDRPQDGFVPWPALPPGTQSASRAGRRGADGVAD